MIDDLRFTAASHQSGFGGVPQALRLRDGVQRAAEPAVHRADALHAPGLRPGDPDAGRHHPALPDAGAAVRACDASLLDAIRSRLLVRASVRLDRVLSGAILDATLARPEMGSQRIAKQAVREFDVLRQTLTGPAMVGLFDAPWVPIYILIAALIHPWIGVLALARSGAQHLPRLAQ